MLDYELLIIIILVIIIFIITYIAITQRLYLIQASDCPKITGEFGVIPDTTSTPLTVCGNNNNEICQSLQSSLSSCIQQCNIRNDICDAFTYDPYSGVMTIVDKNSTNITSTGTNLYKRQVNYIIIK